MALVAAAAAAAAGQLLELFWTVTIPGSNESELLSLCWVFGGSPRGISGGGSGDIGWTTPGFVLRLGYCIAARVRCRTLLD